MCGRYILAQAAAAERYFQVHGTPWSPSFNVAPTQLVPVVRMRKGVRVGETYVEVQSIDPGERVRFAAEAPEGVGAIASAVAFVQSFAAECSGGGPVYPPMPLPGK